MPATNPCRFCGEHLVLGFNGKGWAYYFAPDRLGRPRSTDGVECVKSECLNAGGRVTQHEPIADPQFA